MSPFPRIVSRDPASTEKLAAIHEIVNGSNIELVFQPIVNIRSGKVFGFEALARVHSRHFQSTLDLYRTAVKAGRVGELGRQHRTSAVKMAPEAALFLNIYPNEFDHGWLVRPDDPIFRCRQQVYLEITESVPLSHFDQCFSVISELRKKGIKLAIDDLGAGYSNLKYISDLQPDIVKLDRELVAGIDKKNSRQWRLLRSIVNLCKQMGAQVVVEGIETPEELFAAEMAGADYCQGYLIARPANPPPDVQWTS